jgi:hypothetical protein
MAVEEQHRPEQSKSIIVGLGILWILLALAILALQFVVPPKIEIEWETETEINTAGFNIYRSDSAEGEFVRINPQIIPSQSDAVSGATYLYTDKNVERGKTYYYRLEDIEFDNSTQQHDILTGQVQALNWWTIPLTLVSSVIGVIMLVSGLRQNRKEKQ